MGVEKSWDKFLKSGSVSDYLNFVNSRKENEISEGNIDAFYNGCIGYKGNERRGE